MLPRLPATPEARAKMARAARGRRHSPETKAKIAAARRGKSHSPETKAKIAEKRRARRPESLEQCRMRNRNAHREVDRGRVEQWHADVRKAYEMGEHELLKDVVRSKGLWRSRRIHHPAVSDGWGFRMGGVVWGFPKNLDERVRIGLIKGYVRTNRKRAKRAGLQEAG